MDGDSDACNALLGKAQQEFDKLRLDMSFQGLKQHTRYLDLPDGSQIITTANQGREEMRITVPLAAATGNQLQLNQSPTAWIQLGYGIFDPVTRQINSVQTWLFDPVTFKFKSSDKFTPHNVEMITLSEDRVDWTQNNDYARKRFYTSFISNELGYTVLGFFDAGKFGDSAANWMMRSSLSLYNVPVALVPGQAVDPVYTWRTYGYDSLTSVKTTLTKVVQQYAADPRGGGNNIWQLIVTQAIFNSVNPIS